MNPRQSLITSVIKSLRFFMILLLLATSAEAATPIKNFWPMSDVSSGINRPWWRYTWTNGEAFTFPFNWICTTGAQQDTLTYLSRNDHAFAPPRTQVVVNMTKENICGYWSPTTGRHLRWYSEGWKEAKGSENVHGDILNFLSFRGWTLWERDTSVNTGLFNTLLYPGISPSYVIAGGTGDYIAGSMARQRHLKKGVLGTRVAAERKFPTYGIVPDESVKLKLRLTSGHPELGPNFLQQYDFGHWYNRGNVNGVTYHGCGPVADITTASATCEGEPVGNIKAVWRLRTIPSDYKYIDKLGNSHDVIYSGFAEGIDGDAIVCEEWFFAEDIGPIAMAQYPITTTVGQCLDKLALAHGGVSDPEGYYANPDTRERIIGFQWLEDYCLDNCWVGETSAPPTP